MKAWIRPIIAIGLFKIIVLLVALTLLMNCQKEADQPDCPVDFNVIEGKEESLAGKWSFIRFENKATGAVEHPPCGNNATFIHFDDKIHSRSEEIFTYSYLVTGQVSINSFTRSYKTYGKKHILFSEAVQSKIRGEKNLELFQDKFHRSIKTATFFEINNNLLIISSDESDREMLFVKATD